MARFRRRGKNGNRLHRIRNTFTFKKLLMVGLIGLGVYGIASTDRSPEKSEGRRARIAAAQKPGQEKKAKKDGKGKEKEKGEKPKAGDDPKETAKMIEKVFWDSEQRYPKTIEFLKRVTKTRATQADLVRIRKTAERLLGENMNDGNCLRLLQYISFNVGRIATFRDVILPLGPDGNNMFAEGITKGDMRRVLSTWIAVKSNGRIKNELNFARVVSTDRERYEKKYGAVESFKANGDKKGLTKRGNEAEKQTQMEEQRVEQIKIWITEVFEEYPMSADFVQTLPLPKNTNKELIQEFRIFAEHNLAPERTVKKKKVPSQRTDENVLKVLKQAYYDMYEQGSDQEVKIRYFKSRVKGIYIVSYSVEGSNKRPGQDNANPFRKLENNR